MPPTIKMSGGGGLKESTYDVKGSIANIPSNDNEVSVEKVGDGSSSLKWRDRESVRDQKKSHPLLYWTPLFLSVTLTTGSVISSSFL